MASPATEVVRAVAAVPLLTLPLICRSVAASAMLPLLLCTPLPAALTVMLAPRFVTAIPPPPAY